MKKFFKVIWIILCIIFGPLSFFSAMDQIASGTAGFEAYLDFTGTILLGVAMFISWKHTKKNS